MKKTKFFFPSVSLLLIIILVIIISRVKNPLALKPVYFEGGNVVQEDTFRTNDQFWNFLKVLDYYDEVYSVDAYRNKIFIKRKLYGNKELLMKYTSMSLDSLLDESINFKEDTD